MDAQVPYITLQDAAVHRCQNKSSAFRGKLCPPPQPQIESASMLTNIIISSLLSQ